MRVRQLAGLYQQYSEAFPNLSVVKARDILIRRQEMQLHLQEKKLLQMENQKIKVPQTRDFSISNRILPSKLDPSTLSENRSPQGREICGNPDIFMQQDRGDCELIEISYQTGSFDIFNPQKTSMSDGIPNLPRKRASKVDFSYKTVDIGRDLKPDPKGKLSISSIDMLTPKNQES